MLSTLSSSSGAQQALQRVLSLRSASNHAGNTFNNNILRFTRLSRAKTGPRIIQRLKHDHVGAQEPFVAGDNPPLYDGKPSVFARWAWGLLALDMLFTMSGIDLVMNHWTEVKEETSISGSPSKPQAGEAVEQERQYVIRPLWQRLAFSAGLIAGGVAAGGLILAARDRTVWRMRISRLALPYQPANRTQLPRKPNAPVTEVRHPPNHGPAILTLETASGRRKKHYLHDCELGPGRDATEMILRVPKLRGAFVVRLPRSVILGEKEKDIVPTANSNILIVKGPSPSKIDLNSQIVKGSVESAAYSQLVEVQRRMLSAWTASGGNMRVSAAEPELESGWTSGPVTSNR